MAENLNDWTTEKPQNDFAELWKPTKTGAELIGTVESLGEKVFTRDNGKENKSRYAVVVTVGGDRFQTPAWSSVSSALGNFEVGDGIKITFVEFGAKGSRVCTVQRKPKKK